MAINKIVYDGDTLIDLTGDTVTPETLAEGATAHNKSGEQIIGAMKGGSPVEIEQFWRYEYGDNYIDMIAVSFGGIVCYYCVISYPDGLPESITTDDGTLYDLRDYGGKFLPAVTLDGTPATPDNFNATFMAVTGVNHDITIRLSFLYQLGLEATDIEIKSSGNDLSFIATPGVIFLGMCHSQEEQPSSLLMQSSSPDPSPSPDEIYDALYPVGSVKTWYDNEDHSDFLGFKWERCLAGRFPVGINTGDGDFNAIGKQGGEKTHALTTSEVPGLSQDGVAALDGSNDRVTGYNGSGQPHNNLPPYEVIAPWRRIS